MKLGKFDNEASRQHSYAAAAEILAKQYRTFILQQTQTGALSLQSTNTGNAKIDEWYHTPGLIDAVLDASLAQFKDIHWLGLSRPSKLTRKILEKKDPLKPMLVPVDFGKGHIAALYVDPRPDSFKVVYADAEGQSLPAAVLNALIHVGRHNEYPVSHLFKKEKIKGSCIVLNENDFDLENTAVIAIETLTYFAQEITAKSGDLKTLQHQLNAGLPASKSFFSVKQSFAKHKRVIAQSPSIVSKQKQAELVHAKEEVFEEPDYLAHALSFFKTTLDAATIEKADELFAWAYLKIKGIGPNVFDACPEDKVLIEKGLINGQLLQPNELARVIALMQHPDRNIVQAVSSLLVFIPPMARKENLAQRRLNLQRIRAVMPEWFENIIDEARLLYPNNTLMQQYADEHFDSIEESLMESSFKIAEERICEMYKMGVTRSSLEEPYAKALKELESDAKASQQLLISLRFLQAKIFDALYVAQLQRSPSILPGIGNSFDEVKRRRLFKTNLVDFFKNYPESKVLQNVYQNFLTTLQDKEDQELIDLLFALNKGVESIESEILRATGSLMGSCEKRDLIENFMSRMPLGEWIASLDNGSFQSLVEERNRRAFGYHALTVGLGLAPIVLGAAATTVSSQMGLLPVDNTDLMLSTGSTLLAGRALSLDETVFQEEEPKVLSPLTLEDEQRKDFGFASTATPYLIAFAGVKAAKGTIKYLSDINTSLNIAQAAIVGGVAVSAATGIKVSSYLAFAAVNFFSSLALGTFGMATYSIQNVFVNPLKSICRLGPGGAVKFYMGRAKGTLQGVKDAFAASAGGGVNLKGGAIHLLKMGWSLVKQVVQECEMTSAVASMFMYSPLTAPLMVSMGLMIGDPTGILVASALGALTMMLARNVLPAPDVIEKVLHEYLPHSDSAAMKTITQKICEITQLVKGSAAEFDKDLEAFARKSTGQTTQPPRYCVPSMSTAFLYGATLDGFSTVLSVLSY